MEKEQFIELVGRNIRVAYEKVALLDNEDFANLLEDFKTNNAEEAKNDKFEKANELLQDSCLERIKDLRSKVSSLSIQELDVLESLLHEVSDKSKIENRDGLQDAIAQRRNSLNFLLEIRDYRKVLDEKYGIGSELQHEKEVWDHFDDLDAFPSSEEILKKEEFSDVAHVLGNIELPGGESAEKNVDLFVEQVRNETEMYLICSGWGEIEQDQFEKEFAARLRVSIVELTTAQAISNGVDEESMEQTFDDIVQACSEDKKIEVSKDVFIGWQATKQAQIEIETDKLSKMDLFRDTAIELKQKHKQTDKKLKKEYGKKYEKAKKFAKQLLEGGAWNAAYAIGASMGPVGIGVVSVARLTASSVKLIKDFKVRKAKAEAKAKAEGKEERFTLGTYLSDPKNRMKLCGLALTAAGGFIGFSGTGAEQLIGNLTVDASRMWAGVGLAATGTGMGVIDTIKKTKGPWYKKAWAATKFAGASVVSFVAGALTGRTVGENIDADWFNNTDANVNTDFSDSGSLEPENPIVEENLTEVSTPQEAQVPSEVETSSILDNLSDELSYKVKVLFLSDPKEANEILGTQEWMNSRQLQEAWDNGTLSDDQKIALVNFADERLDAHGHYQDVAGYAPADDMELAVSAASIKESPSIAKEALDQEAVKPVVTEKEAEPVVTEKEAEPVVTEKEAEPVVTEKEAEPVVTEKEAEPVVTEKEAEPVATQKEAEPVATQKEAEPVVTQKEAEPVVTQKEAEPVVTQKEAEPIATQKEAEPVAQKQPTEQTVQEKPAEVKEDPAATQKEADNPKEADNEKQTIVADGYKYKLIKDYELHDDGTRSFTYDMGGTEYRYTIDGEKILDLSIGDKHMSPKVLEALNQDPQSSVVINYAKGYEADYNISANPAFLAVNQKGGR